MDLESLVEEEEIAIGAEVEVGAPADDSVAVRPKALKKLGGASYSAS
jgi:hypothetical protein